MKRFKKSGDKYIVSYTVPAMEEYTFDKLTGLDVSYEGDDLFLLAYNDKLYVVQYNILAETAEECLEGYWVENSNNDVFAKCTAYPSYAYITDEEYAGIYNELLKNVKSYIDMGVENLYLEEDIEEALKRASITKDGE